MNGLAGLSAVTDTTEPGPGDLTLNCLSCDTEIPRRIDWDALDEEIVCPKCGAKHHAQWDETYDPESGTDDGFFYLEKLT